MTDRTWLRTNGVDTKGVDAKVMRFDRLGKKVRPGNSGKIKGQQEHPKSPCQNTCNLQWPHSC